MKKILTLLTLFVLAVACSSSFETDDRGATAQTASPLVVLSPPLPAAAFEGGFEIHGIDGNTQFWFAAIPSTSGSQHAGVIVADRITGHRVGMLPAPIGGFSAVMAVRAQGDRLYVLDAVVDPAHAGFAPAVLHEYAVATSRPFSATLLASRVLPLIPFTEIPAAFGPEPRSALSGIFYPLAFTVVDDGTSRRAIITDAVGGAVWVKNLDSDVPATLVLMDPRLRPIPHVPVFGRGRASAFSTRDYAFFVAPPPAGPGVFPGVFGVTAHSSGQVVFANPSQGGLWKMPLAILLSSASFAEKGASVSPLVTSGTTPDLVAGIDANRFDDDDRFVYFQRTAADASTSFQNVLYRASIDGGAVEAIAASSLVYDWSVSIALVPPPVPHVVVIASAMGQEENNAAVNAALSGTDTFVSPTLIGVVVGISK